MNTQSVSQAISELLFSEEAEDVIEVSDVQTFEEAGVLTQNDGLVLRLPDGSEFQISIVQSK